MSLSCACVGYLLYGMHGTLSGSDLLRTVDTLSLLQPHLPVPHAPAHPAVPVPEGGHLLHRARPSAAAVRTTHLRYRRPHASCRHSRRRCRLHKQKDPVQFRPAAPSRLPGVQAVCMNVLRVDRRFPTLFQKACLPAWFPDR